MPMGVDGEREDAIRVLHAEDDTQLAELTEQFLDREGAFDVVHAADGEEALEALDETVECVVSDYDMPRLNGLELLDEVREQRPEVPFLLFTGKGSEEVASDAISIGVTDYLQKETSTDQYAVLANRIENAVEGYRTERELERRVAQLRESERRFRTLVSNLPGMVYRCRNVRGWPMEFVSDGSVALTGYEPDALESDAMHWGNEVIVDEHRDGLWEAVQVALEQREPFQVEYEIETTAGERKWVWERGRGVFEDDELVALEGVITDVSDERELRDALRRERDITRQLLETSPVGIVVNELDGTFRLVNDSAAEILGTNKKAIKDRTYDDDEWALRTPDGEPLPPKEHGFAKLKSKAMDADSDEEVRVEDLHYSIEGGDGERRLLSVNGAPLYDHDGDLELLVFTLQVVGDA